MTTRTHSAIYTKTGDQGQTGLVSGTRVAKNDLRVELYGTVDELNAHLGVVIALQQNKSLYLYMSEFLIKIQRQLFTLGSNLACESSERSRMNVPALTSDMTSELELKIDSIDKEVGEIRSFILPGGTVMASHIHVCRTVCRRVERLCVSFHEQYPNELPENALVFINRLSDYLFVLARYVNFLEKRRENFWHHAV